MKIYLVKFLMFDGVAALISVPFFVWLGYWIWATFGEDLTQLEKILARTHSVTFWIAVMLGLTLVGYLIIRSRRVRPKS